QRRPVADPPLQLTADGAAADVRTALERAVRRRCDGPACALLLSGGLDSSALAATAVAALEPARLPAIYSLLFSRHPPQNEARWGPRRAAVRRAPMARRSRAPPRYVLRRVGLAAGGRPALGRSRAPPAHRRLRRGGCPRALLGTRRGGGLACPAPAARPRPRR